jgi:hypothetical protein
MGVDARVFRGDFRGLIMPVATPCAELFRASIPREAQAETGLGDQFGSWPGYARLVRGEVMAKKEELLVQVAASVTRSHLKMRASSHCRAGSGVMLAASMIASAAPRGVGPPARQIPAPDRPRAAADTRWPAP